MKYKKVKKKIIIGIVGSLVGMLAISVFSMWIFYDSLHSSNKIVEEYSENQTLKTLFSQVELSFNSLVYRLDDPEMKQIWEDACAKMEMQLRNLPTDYNVIGEERYRRTMSVINSFDGYLNACCELLETEPTSPSFIPRLYMCYDIASYEQLYIDRLIDVTLRDGLNLHNDNIRHLQKLPFIWFILASFFCVCLFFFGKFLLSFDNFQRKALHEQDTQKAKLRQIRTEQRLQEIQIRLLQSQINPHFLFNTLNLISGMAKIEDARNTAEMLQRTSNIFRYNLKAQDSITSLAAEINIANDYFFIQQKRFGTRIQLRWDIRVEPWQISLPTFTLQPLLENSVIHGISPRKQGGTICVRAYKKEDRCYLTVVDNGLGISPAKLVEMKSNDPDKTSASKSGIGVSNIRSRFQILYPGSTFLIKSKQSYGTLIKISWKT